jgi:chromatin assembly factor 1 subunit B
MTGAIDNEVILFSTEGKRRGEHAARFKNHKHFVQGVAWDPAQQYVVTQSADRTCRVYALKPPAGGGRKNKVSQYLLPAGESARDFYCAHTLSKRPMAGGGAGCEAAGVAVEGGKAQSHPLFADERVPTFFRRPAWSPDGERGAAAVACGQLVGPCCCCRWGCTSSIDCCCPDMLASSLLASFLPPTGSLLVVPAGVYKASPEGRELNTAYVYARGKWSSPVMHLPGHTKVGALECMCVREQDAKLGHAGLAELLARLALWLAGTLAG